MLSSLKQAKKGFTIIELLIVIAIIVILAGIVLTNVQGAQAKARDATRVGDIESIRTSLEIYHGEQNHYPQTFNATPDDADQLPGIEEGALTDPRGADSIEILAGQATRAAAITAVTTAVSDGDTDGTSSYVYAAYADTADCTNADTNCTGFVIGTATERPQEDDNNYVIKSSLNQ